MSGGSYNYAYRGVSEMADSMKHSGDPHRMAFGELLCRVSKAMHDIEWVDSCDMSKGGEVQAIKDALGPEPNASVAILRQAVALAEKSEATLRGAIQSALAAVEEKR